LASPLNGKLEKLMKAIGNKPAGFDLINTPVDKLPDHSLYSEGHENFRLGQLFDAYIFLKPLKELKACTPIPGFINEKNLKILLISFLIRTGIQN
jgi:hypothetical protein